MRSGFWGLWHVLSRDFRFYLTTTRLSTRLWAMFALGIRNIDTLDSMRPSPNHFAFCCKVSPITSTVANVASRSALVTSVVVCCGFIICWTPFEIMMFLDLFGHIIDFRSWFYHFKSSTVLLKFSRVKKFLFVSFSFTLTSTWYCNDDAFLRDVYTKRLLLFSVLS